MKTTVLILAAALVGAFLGQLVTWHRVAPLLAESNLAVAIATEHCRERAQTVRVPTLGADFSRKLVQP